MRLFIFEGKKKEPTIFSSLRRCLIDGDDIITFTYNTDFFTFCQKLQSKDYDLFLLLKSILKQRNDNTLDNVVESDISETFLFFDYDFHRTNFDLDSYNSDVANMLRYFDNETEHGKLYINYPMVESLGYFKSLPDARYYSYLVSRNQCLNFKNLVSNFSSDNQLRCIRLNDRDSKERVAEVRANWIKLIRQNVSKANYICNSVNDLPIRKSSVSQQLVFNNQLLKFVEPLDSVSILNSFPIFVWEYLRVMEV